MRKSYKLLVIGIALVITGIMCDFITTIKFATTIGYSVYVNHLVIGFVSILPAIVGAVLLLKWCVNSFINDKRRTR